MLTLRQPPNGEQGWNGARQKQLLRERFADAGWETPRVLSGMEDTDDFYFDVLRQVRLPHWSNGRVVLTGDAAWCVTPIAGMGTTLAVTGAYVLAGELSRIADPIRAFAAYERLMRPMVSHAHGIPRIVPRLMNPHSRLGVRLLHGVLRVATSRAMRTVAAKLSRRRQSRPWLPDYETKHA